MLDDDAITSFRGEFEFLSNFYKADVTFDSKEFSSVEIAYQYGKIKFINELFPYASRISEAELHNSFLSSKTTSGSSKRAGNSLLKKFNREVIADHLDAIVNNKLNLMEFLLRQKFNRFTNPELYDKLDNTGDRELIEGNNWGDAFWGVDVKKNFGLNTLGNMLMRIREENRRRWWDKIDAGTRIVVLSRNCRKLLSEFIWDEDYSHFLRTKMKDFANSGHIVVINDSEDYESYDYLNPCSCCDGIKLSSRIGVVDIVKKESE